MLPSFLSIKNILCLLGISFFLLGCQSAIQTTSPANISESTLKDPYLSYQPYTPKSTDFVISRTQYQQKLYGFWLGQCIANWTGLVTEMDKIGGAGKKVKRQVFIPAKIGDNQMNSTYGDLVIFLIPLPLFLRKLVAFGEQMMIRILNTFINICFMKIKQRN